MKLVRQYQSDLLLPATYVEVPLHLIPYVEPDILHVDFTLDTAQLTKVQSYLVSSYGMTLSSTLMVYQSVKVASPLECRSSIMTVVRQLS